MAKNHGRDLQATDSSSNIPLTESRSLGARPAPPACAELPNAVDEWPGIWIVAEINATHWQHVMKAVRSRGGLPFMPLRQVRRLHGGRKREFQRPIFENYLFVSLPSFTYDPLDVHDVMHVIDVVDQAKFRRELRQVQLAWERGIDFEPFPHYVPGKRVRLTRPHPLAGLEGYIIRRQGRGLFVVSLGILQAGTDCEDVSAEEMELIE